jgi:hypothetical protein
MAICCGGKKQKVSHSITSSIANRRSSDKQNGTIDHNQNLKPNLSSSTRHRSHSHFNHRQTNTNHTSMPHDLSRSTANSASSSALTYSYNTPQGSSSSTTPNNHYYHKMTKKVDPMDVSDNDEDQITTEDKNKQQKKVKQTLENQEKYSIVHADMIFYCFEILGNHLFSGKHHLNKHHSSLTTGQLIASSPIMPPALPADPYPLFVTWFIGSEQKLRGCIGTFTPMNLGQGK